MPATFHHAFTLLLGLILCQCSHEPRLAPFRTDGCTLLPEQSPGGTHNWRDCCIQHDLDYWKGGSEDERLASDQRLHDCILRKTDNPEFAKLVFETVKETGRPDYPTWYRWGYGWNYLRPASPLTPAEQAMVTERMKTANLQPCTNCGSRKPRRHPAHR